MLALLIIMALTMHIIGDFVLQGNFLANAKQKNYWIKQIDLEYPADKVGIDKHQKAKRFYQLDFIPVLLSHSLLWTSCIFLPIGIYLAYTNQLQDMIPIFTIEYILNLFMHAIVDDLKANDRVINLCIDQLLHILQIAVTYVTLLH